MDAWPDTPAAMPFTSTAGRNTREYETVKPSREERVGSVYPGLLSCVNHSFFRRHPSLLVMSNRPQAHSKQGHAASDKRNDSIQVKRSTRSYEADTLTTSLFCSTDNGILGKYRLPAGRETPRCRPYCTRPSCSRGQHGATPIKDPLVCLVHHYAIVHARWRSHVVRSRRAGFSAAIRNTSHSGRTSGGQSADNPEHR